MATITTTGFNLRSAHSTNAAAVTRKHRRREVSPAAGRALEILGHAIEYLADELVHEAKQVDGSQPQVQAIQILMALNRQVYYECPFAPTFAERLRALLRMAPRAGLR